MNVYVDSSVLLRFVFDQPGRLEEWPEITTSVSSELARVECLRAIDRVRLREHPDDETLAERRGAALKTLAGCRLMAVASPVMARAADPFPTVVGSLDAIHLSTALLAREEYDDLAVATHDNQMATAAEALGFEVLG